MLLFLPIYKEKSTSGSISFKRAISWSRRSRSAWTSSNAGLSSGMQSISVISSCSPCGASRDVVPSVRNSQYMHAMSQSHHLLRGHLQRPWCCSSEEKETAFRKSKASLIQTLQLLVPVISTTFASAGRFFRYVNKLDALGTIIVDEAGQATPQTALRLFSKASKAIVVGDPNQIDPVVSDELSWNRHWIRKLEKSILIVQSLFRKSLTTSQCMVECRPTY